MPRACPVEIHDGSYTESYPNSPDATGLPRGDSRSLLFSSEREPSTAQGRGIQFCWLVGRVASSVSLHGTSPWHLRATYNVKLILGQVQTAHHDLFDALGRDALMIFLREWMIGGFQFESRALGWFLHVGEHL